MGTDDKRRIEKLTGELKIKDAAHRGTARGIDEQRESDSAAAESDSAAARIRFSGCASTPRTTSTSSSTGRKRLR
jgi:hypothetical protein